VEMDRGADALASFEKAIEVDAGFEDAYLGKADVQARQGRYEEASRRSSWPWTRARRASGPG